jgi:hypothetical protein
VAFQQAVGAVVVRATSDAENLAMLDMSPDDMADPGNQAKFDAWAKRTAEHKDLKNNAAIRDAFKNYKIAAGHVGQKPYDASLVGIWAEKPYRFPGAGYQPGDNPALRAKAMKEADRMGVTQAKRLSEMGDQELKAEFEVLGQVKAYLAGAASELPAPEKAKLLGDIGVDPTSPGTRAMVDKPDQIPDMMERVHKIRALKAEEPAKPAAAPSPIIIQMAQPTPEERGKPQELVESMANALEEAARSFEESDAQEDEEKANQLFHYAAGLREDKNKVHTREQADDLIMRDSAVIALWQEHMKKKEGAGGATGGKILS